ncbi:cholecystokinin receptor-like [Centruroides sculpturatus]|uniref:cholecystokinin receptor-like n=1 Tax=Centruroides sculpturatus TaxID=218467 RepID=UPI000C6EDB1D|nr:cholecystokinin receptor-like [Centruroides sculpturatus]
MLLNNSDWIIGDSNGTIIINDINNETLSLYFSWSDDALLRICLYSIIFIFAILGNSLVIITLAQNKRMRTVTNVFLLNLAISDLLLGVFCMPVTLIGGLLRDFVFGSAMCRLFPYLQAVSVSVTVWTLVAISLERFFAICRPLHSRRWQTVSHAYKVIAAIWIGSLSMMLPIACLSRLIPLRSQGKHKCREVWPTDISERIFNIYLDAALMAVPLIIMVLMYSLITRTLCSGVQMENHDFPLRLIRKHHSNDFASSCSNKKNLLVTKSHVSYQTFAVARSKTPRHLIIRGNLEKSQASKKRIVRMLFVVVVEFFVCWSPLYIVNTWSLFDQEAVYSTIGYSGVSIIQLLAYISSCCNPITYCFMHKKFRKSFVSTCSCRRKTRRSSTRWSDKSATMNSICSIRGGSVRVSAVL